MLENVFMGDSRASCHVVYSTKGQWFGTKVDIQKQTVQVQIVKQC